MNSLKYSQSQCPAPSFTARTQGACLLLPQTFRHMGTEIRAASVLHLQRFPKLDFALITYCLSYLHASLTFPVAIQKQISLQDAEHSDHKGAKAPALVSWLTDSCSFSVLGHEML